MSFYRKYGKRVFDLCLTVPAFVVLSPVMLVTAGLVAVKLGRPVLFTQERPGYKEKIFRMYKFRTMTDARNANGELLSDEERLTPFGEKLRSTSLDELPELLNILKGDMSLVGPRPLLVQYLPLYNKRQHKRHSVLPGITGLAQINGRNSISWEEKFEYDVQYAKHVTFLGDLKILFETVFKVLKREGINSENSATMEDFTGTPEERG
ncbi:sugar transferase [Hominiventricola filiformis]|uniref:Sugar transferase n=1 Tax=Hominiventricola filiformis TaxID=2885352 RepID=A0AAE3D972_9FIRM|nr:sugar transferase [Hominiventricola filiformis]MCC2125358.1 sugar transferase [Hominiventricola filiformis]